MKVFGDIRFWIGLFFCIRLYGITNPPLEIGHNWRQTTVTMPARNFLETDPNIFYPRIDIAGEKTGITGMEFPILNYIIFLQAKVFGYAHWYGRLINLIVSSIGLFYFYKLIKKYFQPEIALYATLILLFSIWFSYSRKIMPDTFSMSFMLAGIFYGSNYLDKGNKVKDLMLYAVLVLIGMLSKLPSAYIAVVFLFFLFNRQITNQAKILFSTVSVVMLSVVSAWYFYWVPYLVNTYGFSHFFMGEGMMQGAKEIFAHLPETLKKFYAESLKYAGFAFFLAGIFIAFRKSDTKMIWIFSLSFLSFLLLVVFKSGFAFYHHIYYIIPFVPVMALVAAYAVSHIKNKKIGIAVLLLITLENLLNQYPDFNIKKDYAAVLNLEADLDKFSDKNDLVLINSGDYPTPMYFAHRKGWVAADARIGDTAYVSELKGKGLKFIVILKKVFGENMPMQLSNDNYDIYKL